MFGSFLEGSVVELDDVCCLYREYMRQFLSLGVRVEVEGRPGTPRESSRWPGSPSSLA